MYGIDKDYKDGYNTNWESELIRHVFADVAELADAHGSGPCGSNSMQVQVLSSAVNAYNPNLADVRIIGDGFGFLLLLE